jgi:dolichol-phosphate mannosyltransferase
MTPHPELTELVALSVVVSCCDEADGLYELHRRLSASCRHIAGSDYELVFVNDGSTDATWQQLRELSDKDDRVVAVDLSRRHGHQIALSAGLSLTCGERVLVIDADLQDPPELLPQMFELMDAGADVVYGQRSDRAGESLFKRASAAFFYRLLARLSSVPIPRDTGDFRLMSRRAVDALLRMPEQHRFIRGMVSWIGFHQVPIAYSRAQRYAGRSKYSLGRMLRFSVDGLTGVSTAPLRVASAAGGLALAVAAALALHALFAPGSSEWSAASRGLAALVLAVSGVQLVCIGILGEYVARIFLESKRRPLFVIRDVLRRPDPRGPRSR